MTNTTNPPATFAGLGIDPNLLKQLEKLNFKIPTPIQHQVIPVANKNEDLMGIAQTGTGKTLAFAVPMIQKIMAGNNFGLVIVPTRELALQVEETFKNVSRNLNIRTVVLIGGLPMFRQIKELQTQPKIIIATPGRLIDHLQRKTVNLSRINILVLDEADRMLDMGFEPDIKKILAGIPKEKRQTMLFSATMPEKITNIAKAYLRQPLRIEVSPAGSTVKDVEQEVFVVQQTKKTSLLKELLNEYKGTILIFSRTKYGAKKIALNIRQMGHTSAEIHSNKSLSQRRQALDGFKSGKYRILVATDIAARGIDVANIELVINFDLPDNPEDYVHRIGRTARAGKRGKAISLVTPQQSHDLKIIENLIKTRLTVKNLPNFSEQFEDHKFAPVTRPNSYRGARRPFNRNRRASRNQHNRHQKPNY